MSDRRIINEQAHRQGVFVSVSVIADSTAREGDVRDAIRVAAAKANGKFFPDAPASREAFAPRVSDQLHLPFGE